MTYQKYITSLICICVYSMAFHVISADQACDKSKCKGPIKYYEDLKCIPIYSSEDSCCAVKYNCDHLKGRSKDKCYFRGHVYDINDSLKEGDGKPCDIGCSCSEGWDGVADFTCAAVDCFETPQPGCYLKESHSECCPGPEVCPQDGTEIARCEVDGETYLDGQRFTPKSDPTQSCICSPGYTGENVSPFCQTTETWSCDPELHWGADIYNNCTPAYYSSQSPVTDCHFASRCQNKDDRVLESTNATEIGVSPVADLGTCAFGQLTMKVGDQLNSGTHYSSVCLKCVCEVPPVPTCQRLPDSECDVTVHAKFDDFSK